MRPWQGRGCCHRQAAAKFSSDSLRALLPGEIQVPPLLQNRGLSFPDELVKAAIHARAKVRSHKSAVDEKAENGCRRRGGLPLLQGFQLKNFQRQFSFFRTFYQRRANVAFGIGAAVRVIGNQALLVRHPPLIDDEELCPNCRRGPVRFSIIGNLIAHACRENEFSTIL